MKKRYELIQNGICLDWFEKNSTGLEQAYQQAEQVLVDHEGSFDELWQLEIQFITYDACGKIVRCELVHEFDLPDYGDDMDESMDGDFDSAMTSAGFGTDEDYGCFGGEDY
tara:strand:- start:72 stop:404 length:333 start_codon:yes stop_codon:yes gene_type:complete